MWSGVYYTRLSYNFSHSIKISVQIIFFYLENIRQLVLQLYFYAPLQNKDFLVRSIKTTTTTDYLLLQLSHRFNLEHTLLKRKPKGENCYISTTFVSNGKFGLFQKSKWVEDYSLLHNVGCAARHILFHVRSFSEYHTFQETMLLPTTLQPWHSFSVYLLLSSAMHPRLRCLSPSFQRPRSRFLYDTTPASLYFTLFPARKNLKASLARPSFKASEAV